MKIVLLTLSLIAGNLAFSQTIRFKGCVPLFDDQQFTLNETGLDLFNKKIYVTTPVTGDQPCGGLGTCEFKIQWNNAQSRWEFLADTGNGDFVNPFLIYYSTAQNTSANNPPNISIGSWKENTGVTSGDCGGDLTNANATMTGDVRTTVLAVAAGKNLQFSVAPNPATDYLVISGLRNIQYVNIVSADGRVISSQKGDKINVSALTPGAYLLEIRSGKEVKTVKFIKK